MSKAKIHKCPHCGSTEGYYIKIDYLRVRADYTFDGEPVYSSGGGIADSAEVRREGKTAYCSDCDKEICRVSSLRK